GPGLGASPRPVSILTDEELKEEKRRFTHVCQLLTRARRPLVSLNGILALIPFSLVEAGASGAVEITNAARGDLEAGAKALEVRCPVIVLFTGMEKQKGFRELVRRIGWESASEQRFGKGFHIWTTPTSQQMQALCSHACGQFERWIYNFFQQKDAPWNPGNRKLYALLCTIRQDLQQVLNSVLIGGFSQERDSANDHPFLISGCYFAATGKDEQSQAFVKAVFDRMIDQQASLEWTKEAIDNEKRYRGLARMGMLINVLLGLALVGLVITNFMPM
ncbi:MAG: type VI secretion system protein, partial [Planctomycetales bacterium]